MKNFKATLVSAFLALTLISCGNVVKPTNPDTPQKPDVDTPVNPDDNKDPDKPVEPDKDPDKPVDPNPDVDPDKPVDPNPDVDPDTKPGEPVEGEYYRINSDDLKFTYQEINEKGLNGILPASGNPNVVVVPVNFSDLKNTYSFSTSNLNILDNAFNGNKIDGTTGYWESCSSFYKKTSRGKLNINFEICDPWTPSITSRDFVDLETQEDGNGTYALIEEVTKTLKKDNKPVDLSSSHYDSNNDGFTDAVWFIYNDNNRSHQMDYWPYVFWYYPTSVAQEENPISAYGNCSVSFLFDDDIQGRDAHTIIHETGHLLGLDDYYTYDVNNITGEPLISGIGGLDIMADTTSGTHNPFSTTALGWTDIIVPTKPGRFTLKPFIKDNEAIILANPDTFTGSAFSEYLILDYYRPEGLNELDATHDYQESGVYYFNEPGLRIYHVDARLKETKVNLETGNVLYATYPNLKGQNLKTLLDDSVFYSVGHSNTRSWNAKGEQNEDLIAIIPQDNRSVYKKRFVDNDALFKVGDKFDASVYGKFFISGNFNDGSKIPFKVEVVSMNETEMILDINF